ncbi:MAG: DMT family transporter [Thaumarchaeota archaeon]|nr:MAG: DMT family transporter [Nitrososphaerota archaeon]
MNLKEWVAFLGLLGIWGTSFIFVKIGLAYSPSFIFASLRQFVGAAAMLPYILSKRESFPKSAREFLPIIPLGIFNVTITNGSSFTALKVVPAGLATVIAYTQPIWVFVFAIFILKDKMNSLKVLGTVLGFLGIATVFLPGVQISQAYFGGEVLLIFSSLSWGIGAILFKAKVRTESLYMVNFFLPLHSLKSAFFLKLLAGPSGYS